MQSFLSRLSGCFGDKLYICVSELSSCIDYQLRCYPSGMYELDFDGYSGSLPPVLAYCDMSTTPPTTIVHTTNSCDNKVQGHRESKNYTMKVDYVLPDEVYLSDGLNSVFYYVLYCKLV